MGKYLNFHEKFLKRGVIHPKKTNLVGLCSAMRYDRQLSLFEPTAEEHAFDKNLWWGSGSEDDPKKGEYTPNRQNIVLFLAAMAGEL